MENGKAAGNDLSVTLRVTAPLKGEPRLSRRRHPWRSSPILHSPFSILNSHSPSPLQTRRKPGFAPGLGHHWDGASVAVVVVPSGLWMPRQ